MRKPDNIVFWLNDRIPAPTALGLVLQQMAFLGALLVVPNLFIHGQAVGLDSRYFLDIAGATLISGALAILLQIWNRWGVGSGYYYPMQATPTAMALMFLAASQPQGVALAYGMLVVVGVTQLVLSGFVVKLRSIFTVEVAGLMVMLTGISTGQIGLRLLFGASPDSEGADQAQLLVAAITFATLIFVNVWVKSRMRLFAALIGLLAGTVAAYFLDVLEPESLQYVVSAPWFKVPELGSVGWQFSADMIWPFMLLGLTATLMSIGTQTVAQRVADADWQRPDVGAYARGLRAEGLAYLLMSFFNAMPQTASGGAVGLAATSGSASRYLGYWVAGIMVITAFCSKLIVLWLAVPAPAIAALLMFLAAYLLMAGLKLIASRMLDDRRSLALGVGLIIGVSHQYIEAGINYQPLAGIMEIAGVANGTLAALVLTALFRIGAAKRTQQRFRVSQASADDMKNYLENQGRLWGARRDAVQRAEQAVWQAFDLLAHSDRISPVADTLDVATRFDEYALRVTFSYRGKALPQPQAAAPSADQLLHDPDGTAHMTAYLLSRLARKTQSRQKGDLAQLQLEFEA